VKLDLHVLRLDALGGVTALQSLAPIVLRAVAEAPGKRQRGRARSLALLAHSFGAALVALPQGGEPDKVYGRVLQELFKASMTLPSLSFRERFQLISALQCWWFAFGGPERAAFDLSIAWQALQHWNGGTMPTATESADGQDWVSTKDHCEVVDALPERRRSNVRLEEFVFPFWIDVLIPAPLPLPSPATARQPGG